MTVRTHEPLTDPLTTDEFWAGDPHPHLTRLRAEAPIAWDDHHGLWAVSRHRDITAISRDPQRFCSSEGVVIGDLEREWDEPGALLYVDPPEHTRYRKLIQPAFSPGRMREFEDQVRARARALLDAEVRPGEELDFAQKVSVPFPLVIIAELLGVPVERWPEFYEWSDLAIEAASAQTPETNAAMVEMGLFFMNLVEERHTDPADDLVSFLANVEIDGESLTKSELLMLLIQLLVAGNETTRNLISGGLVALAQHPDQWERLVADRSLVPTAVEELLRWTTPVVTFLRTATCDTEVADVQARQGDRFLLLYPSANRDEDEFGATAQTLDVGRDPNHHVAFGFGTHFCIGAMLARIEGRVLLEEILDRYTRIELVGTPEIVPSATIAGIRHASFVFAA